ncbi:MAG: hypothetical protein HF962_06735 [Sulfurovum sp.]|nr:hypothetical protein [Sulfurovum sp.]
MEPTFIIAFREGLEAFLILGIILAFLQKTDLGHFKKYAWWGFYLGIVASIVLGVILTIVIDGFESEDLQYNISLIVLFIAIVLLTYVVFWMQHNSDISNMQNKIELSANKKWVAFLIVFTAILREGLETVLFTFALMMDGEITLNDALIGLSAGFVVSAIIIWILFKTSIKLPLKKFFQYSSYLILIIVAGLTSMLIKGLQAYEYLPTYMAPLYDSSWLLANDSSMGKFLGILMGYDAMPSLLQALSWVGYLVFVGILLFIKGKKHA